MRTFALVLSTALCLSALPALAGAPGAHNGFITLAETDVTIGPGGVFVGDRDRDRDRERDKLRLGRERDHDKHCRTETVDKDGDRHTRRHCD